MGYVGVPSGDSHFSEVLFIFYSLFLSVLQKGKENDLYQSIFVFADSFFCRLKTC